jgi:hypothetical protein
MILPFNKGTDLKFRPAKGKGKEVIHPYQWVNQVKPSPIDENPCGHCAQRRRGGPSP